MKNIFGIILLSLSITCCGAYQYNTNGNQGWITFDSVTDISFDLSTTGKDKDHENFIDRG